MELSKVEDLPRITVRGNTVEEETRYVWDKIKRIEFFNRFGYDLTLPKNPVISDLISKSLGNVLGESDWHLLESEILKIYNISNYKNGIETIEKSLNVIKSTFNLFYQIAERWDFKIFDEYLIRLTQFGPGGSYDNINGHIIMKANKYGLVSKRKKPIETIIHEIVHIGIEDEIIQKYSITHEIKERIVDKFMVDHFRDLFPDYHLQGFGDVAVDKYLNYNDSWDRLPHYIQLFLEGNPVNKITN